MKKILLLVAILLTFTSNVFAQEKAKPLIDQEVMRRVALIDVEGTTYENVVVSMKSASLDDFVKGKDKVKVVITDSQGKKIWKKTLKNVCLYVFSNGQVLVGKSGFVQLVIQKSSYTDDFVGMIREKEGIY